MGKSCCTERQQTKSESYDEHGNSDSLKCHSCPGAIKCKRTSFHASFASSASEKHTKDFQKRSGARITGI